MQENEMSDALYQEPTAENIQEFIMVLDKHRENCEEDGKYVEAEMAKNRVAELRAQDYHRKFDEMVFN
jgi:hypothetical protein